MAYGNGKNAPTGFVPTRYLNGSSWNEQTNQYRIASAYADDLGQGDLVTLGDGVIEILSEGGGEQVLGVFWGCQYLDSNGKMVYSNQWVGNTAVYQGGYATAFVVDDPNVLFSVQVADSTNARNYLQIGDLYDNADFVVADPNPLTGLSTAYLDINTIAHTATLNLKIYDLDPKVGNNFGTATTYNYNNALVLLNNHVYKSVGTLGV